MGPVATDLMDAPHLRPVVSVYASDTACSRSRPQRIGFVSTTGATAMSVFSAHSARMSPHDATPAMIGASDEPMPVRRWACHSGLRCG